MEKKEKKTCCFFGHRKILEKEDLKIKLYQIIETLIIDSNADTFLFGSKSEFDQLCREVVGNLKEKHTHIKRIYVRAEFPEINEDYKKYLLEDFEDTYFPKRAINAGRAVYIERNCEIIDRSDICIVYYTDNYAPAKRRNSKRDLFAYQPKSGTSIAYQYAESKNKKIINVINI